MHIHLDDQGIRRETTIERARRQSSTLVCQLEAAEREVARLRVLVASMGVVLLAMATIIGGVVLALLGV